MLVSAEGFLGLYRTHHTKDNQAYTHQLVNEYKIRRKSINGELEIFRGIVTHPEISGAIVYSKMESFNYYEIYYVEANQFDQFYVKANGIFTLLDKKMESMSLLLIPSFGIFPGIYVYERGINSYWRMAVYNLDDEI